MNITTSLSRARFVILGICFFFQVTASAIPCSQLAASNLEKKEKVFPVQLLNLHHNGIEIPEMDFAGPGLCFSTPIRGLSSEEKEFSFEVLGAGGGRGRFSYLKKQGGKEAMIFRFGSYPLEEATCSLHIQRDEQLATHAIRAAYINQYDPSTGIYTFQGTSDAFDFPENREIRMVAEGKGITVHVVSVFALQYTICYFPKR